MANRYWVGGSGTWDTTSTTNWSASSGGAGGASRPTAADSVFFDQAGTYTVTMTGALTCLDITVSAGTVTFATGTSPTLNIAGSMSLLAGTVWSSTGAITFSATTTGKTVTTNGVTISGPITFNGLGGGWTLGSALTNTGGGINVTAGSFNSGNFAITSFSFTSNSSLTRSVILGSSTVTLNTNSSSVLNLATITNLTWNAGTSQINLTGGTTGIGSAGLTFYNVTIGAGLTSSTTITGANTFNTLEFSGRTNAGINTATFSANQTISTLTLNAGTASAFRTFLASSTIGTQITLSVGTLTAGAADYDFRDIAITGAAAPIAPTRAGDCKGNSGITFPAAKTVYFRGGGSQNWGLSGSGSWNSGVLFLASCSGTTLTTIGSPALVVGMLVVSNNGVSLGSITSGSGNSWVVSVGGSYSSQTMLGILSADATQFPLPQDTAVFWSGVLPPTASTITINANYNIGTIDMSARTSATMTLATGTTTPTIYGNWINGTGTNLTGAGRITFSGRGSQTITSAGKTFPQPFTLNTPGGSVTLQDAFASSSASSNVLGINTGTFDSNGYSVNFTSTLPVTQFGTAAGGTSPKTLAIGSSTWTLAGSGSVWSVSGSNLTVTGTGTISLTSASAKTFAGNDVQTYPTLNQGGTGALTITGSNKFANITNTAIGSVLFTSGTTNEFSAFNLNGASGNLLTLGATTTSQATLKKPSSWLMGANSTDGGNNTGLSFSAGGGIDYLNVSYINGQTTVTYTGAGNFFPFFS